MFSHSTVENVKPLFFHRTTSVKPLNSSFPFFYVIVIILQVPWLQLICWDFFVFITHAAVCSWINGWRCSQTCMVSLENYMKTYARETLGTYNSQYTALCIQHLGIQAAWHAVNFPPHPHSPSLPYVREPQKCGLTHSWVTLLWIKGITTLT